MSLNAVQLNAISNACKMAKYLVETAKPSLDEIDNVYNAAGGLASTITQADLDAVASYSGLTTTQLADLMYALTSTIKGGITTAYTALEAGAERGN